MENQKSNVENKVMSEIKSGKIKLRSKYIFLAEKLGLGSAFVLSVLLAVLLFSLTFFYLKASDDLVYLSFGHRGILAFLESFPYLLVVCFVVFIFIAGYLIKRSEVAYKKPFGFLAMILVLFVVLSGAVLAFTTIGERFEGAAYGRKHFGFLRSFLQRGFDKENRGVAGRVIEIGEGFLMIQTPIESQKVDVTKIDAKILENVKAGDFVFAIGERKDEIFYASEIKTGGEADAPMMRRGVHRRFGPMSPDGKARPEFFDKLNKEGGQCGRDCVGGLNFRNNEYEK